MTTPHRSYLPPVDAAPAAPAGSEHRPRYFSSGETARGGAGGRPPPLRAYARLHGGADIQRGNSQIRSNPKRTKKRISAPLAQSGW